MLNRKTAINNLIAQIRDNEHEEIFRCIEHIETRPYEGMLKIRFYLSAIARMTVTVHGDELQFNAAGMPQKTVSIENGLFGLRTYMYEIDSLIADGYQQPTPKMRVISVQNPPANMDIPVWDEKEKTWHDAEY